MLCVGGSGWPLVVSTVPGGGEVFSQLARFHGPRGDNCSPETGLLERWPEGGPELLWTARGIGRGFSSVSVAGGRLTRPATSVTSSRDGIGSGRESVVAGPGRMRVEGRLSWHAVHADSQRGTGLPFESARERLFYAETGDECWSFSTLDECEAENITGPCRNRPWSTVIGSFVVRAGLTRVRRPE